MSRSDEATEIVQIMRAAAVGRLMLGEIHEPLNEISKDEYEQMPRQQLKLTRARIKESIYPQLKRFCDSNFENTKPEKLASLYNELLLQNSHLRIPLSRFKEKVGNPKPNVLNGAPAHATVCISPWGLQTEFPEMHLVRDVAFSFNQAFANHKFITELGNVSWEEAKQTGRKTEIAEAFSMLKFNGRMCLLSCFNLLEAYINGLAWEYSEMTDITKLSNNKQSMITGDKGSLLDRLVSLPPIIAGKEDGPLVRDRDPIAGLGDIIKPFRDSIVHASPFSKPDRFGGYQKLDKVYSLDFSTVKNAVDLSIQVILRIDLFLGGGTSGPTWIPGRAVAGDFIVEHS
jgi:hypothetical protein